MSKQLRWQRKQVSAGNCGLCGRPRRSFGYYCDRCNIIRNVRRRKPVEVRRQGATADAERGHE